MAHHCIDWTATPPTRKTPLLVLTRGDDHVYTVVPKELKTLEQVARREFDLGNVEIHFSSACANLCNGRPARITETAWEHISPFIGCATVEVSAVMDVEGPSSRGSVKRKLPPDADEVGENENDRSDDGPSSKPSNSGKAAVRDEGDAPSDHGNDRDGASASEDRREEPWEEEVSAIAPRKSRTRRRLVSDNEDDEGDTSEREHQAPAGSEVPPVASPPKLSQPGKEVKKETHSYYLPRQDTEVAEPLQGPSKPIKQEKSKSGDGSASRPNSHDGSSELTHTESQSDVGMQPQAESSEIQKLMIRVAHRPSQQESKFTTKNTTKVGKVLMGVCKSFGLDASLATLYLIVSTEDEHGEEENLFPCDKNDTIARAGAERDTESKFLLKMAGEA